MKDLSKPSAISGKERISGIIKCFKSIKKIIIKNKLKIVNNSVVIDML